jgi:pimeloyl-ACP methyl ester carboxylesterase
LSHHRAVQPNRRLLLQRVLAATGVIIVAGAVGTTATYVRDMRRAYARIDGASKLVASPFGDIEYAEGGSGPAVLVVHGSGGGYDQGELIARAVLSERFRWIAPSRFGYLRSTFQPGATFDEQANAFAWLLDQLHVNRVAVVALSHGGPSALLFSVLHPERVSSLTLISAGVASSVNADQQQANRQGDALMRIFQQDVRYWAVSKLLRKQLLGIMGASDDVIAALTPEQKQLANDVIDLMNPVSRRAAGTVFDNQASMPNERISAIRAPTLILHARDDTLQIFRNAEYAANTIPHARLVSFERGGHLLLAVEQAAIRGLVQQHIVEHAGTN